VHRDPEITYIRGNVRVVQSLVAGEVQFGIAGSAGAVPARAAGEEVIIAVGVSGAAIKDIDISQTAAAVLGK
jgi:hypothetical protein